MSGAPGEAIAAPRSRVPFALRRPWLLLRDLGVRRDAPDLSALSRLADPEAFVWTILPHAARTFSACILMLPERFARPSAIAYLYCRILDTYEDLVPDPDERERALAAFAARWGEEGGGSDVAPVAAPALDPALARDARDATHVLLVNRCALVDAAYARLRPDVRRLIRDLVARMSASMRWSSRAFEQQRGVLRDGEQLARYCDGVLGSPMLFCARLMRLERHGLDEVPPSLGARVREVGEFLQLANITRDIEKDLARGVAYHPALVGDLGVGADADGNGDRDAPLPPDVAARVATVRAELLTRALQLRGSLAGLVDELELSRVSLSRASALLMMLFTERYYRGCALKLGWPGATRGPSGLRLLLRAASAAWSPAAATRAFERSEAALAALTR